MSRCHETEDAELVGRAFASLNLETKQILRQELCATGMEPEGAILLYYAPALVNNISLYQCTIAYYARLESDQ